LTLFWAAALALPTLTKGGADEVGAADELVLLDKGTFFFAAAFIGAANVTYAFGAAAFIGAAKIFFFNVPWQFLR